MVRVARLDRARHLAHQRVEVARLRRLPLPLRQLLGGGRLPLQAVVVLVAQQPHQHARRVPEAVHQVEHLRGERGARARIGVVRLRHVDPALRGAVPAQRVVEDRVDPVAVVDVPHPARRQALGVDADRVHPHRLQQRHLVVQRGLDHRVRLPPQAVRVVLPDGEVVPVHAANQEIAAVDLQALAGVVTDDTHARRLARRGRRQQARQHGRRTSPGARPPQGLKEWTHELDLAGVSTAGGRRRANWSDALTNFAPPATVDKSGIFRRRGREFPDSGSTRGQVTRGDKRRRHTAKSGVAPGVGLARLELATSRLSGVRSNHLSYRPRTGSRCSVGRPVSGFHLSPKRRQVLAAPERR